MLRARIILLKSDAVALIQRVRDGQTYYVFPGGGVERDETPADAAAREAWEELGITVAVQRLIAVQHWAGYEIHYFLALMTGGRFGTGQGREYTRPDPAQGTYRPVWITLSELSRCEVRPRELAAALAAGPLPDEPLRL